MASDSSGRANVVRRALALSVVLGCAWLSSCGGQSESKSNDDAGTSGASGSSSGGDGSGGTSSGGTVPGGTSSGGTAPGGSAGTGGDVCDSRTPDEPWGTVEMPLEAYCGYFLCSSSFGEAIAEEQARCNGMVFGQTLKQGCGFSALGSDGGFGGGWEVFDASGALVGANGYSDVTFGPCSAASYRAGVEFPPCDEAVTCAMCMTLDTLPVCRFDCDCTGEQPIDPCFSADSCQCYCARLEGTAGR